MSKSRCTQCDRRVVARGLCPRHYQAARNSGELLPLPPKTAAERFWAKVEKTDNHWLWKGYRDRNDYGQMRGNGGRLAYAHRFSYEMHVGPIPEGLVLDHLCRTPPCVNPEHLEPVTQQVNVLRGAAFSSAEAQQTKCLRGHPFDDVNTAWAEGGRKRRCRQCRAMWNEVRRDPSLREQMFASVVHTPRFDGLWVEFLAAALDDEPQGKWTA